MPDACADGTSRGGPVIVANHSSQGNVAQAKKMAGHIKHVMQHKAQAMTQICASRRGTLSACEVWSCADTLRGMDAWLS